MSFVSAVIAAFGLHNVDPSVVKQVDMLARKHHVDPVLYHALVMNESAYNPKAINLAGNPGVAISSFGIGQLTRDTAKWFCDIDSEDDLLDVNKNTSCSVRYFAWQIKRYSGDINKAVSAYNAGSYVKWNKWYNDKVFKFRDKLLKELEDN